VETIQFSHCGRDHADALSPQILFDGVQKARETHKKLDRQNDSIEWPSPSEQSTTMIEES
jgi:hypothetical protein